MINQNPSQKNKTTKKKVLPQWMMTKKWRFKSKKLKMSRILMTCLTICWSEISLIKF